MRKRLVKLTLLGAAGLALGAAGFALAGTSTLSLTYAGPEPETVTVPWGDTLRITNVDSVSHAIVSSHSELQTGVVLPGRTFTAMITGRRTPTAFARQAVAASPARSRSTSPVGSR